MIRFIEAPDLHFDLKWAETSAQCFKAIKDAVIKYQVDFIVIPGDLFNRPLIASERGGLNMLRSMIKSIGVPIAAIEGTPAHDAPGCYESLEGVTLLKPDRVYGFLQKYNKNASVLEYPCFLELSGYFSDVASDCILFGLPELNKDMIMLDGNYTAEQANAEAVKRFNEHILNFMAPMRQAYSCIPAIALFHSNVSDYSRENEIDKIFQASDIVMHTEDMKPADITRWSLGHIHIPWESSVICGGYAGGTGIDDRPWNNTGFKPAMNLVEINDSVKITRLPYGTPTRLKITEPLPSYDHDIAYWLHTKNPDDPEPTGHPWSRKTIDEEKTVTHRVESEKIIDATLPDLFKLIDPSVNQSVLDKVASLEESTKLHVDPAHISLDYIEISGCDFFGGKKVCFDISKLPHGLTAIMGENGAGKSALFSFCTFWPVIVGKDTDNGRQSAIKDFFHLPGAQIIKHITKNEEKHRHIINIKGSHTKNPKVECSLFINDIPQLEKGSFEEMLMACYHQYGDFEDYILTSFSIQPQQSRMQIDLSLADANMTTLRNLVQSIAGIDREREKMIANNKIQELKTAITENQNYIRGAMEWSIDTEKLEKEIKIKTARVEKGNILMSKIEKTIEVLKPDIYNMSCNADINNQAKKDKIRQQELNDKISGLQSAIEMLDLNKATLEAETARRERMETRQKIINSNQTKKNNYDAKLLAYNKEVNEKKIKADKENQKNETLYNKARFEYTMKKTGFETDIKRNDNPCEYCGKLPSDSEKIIERANQGLKDLIEPIKINQIQPDPVSTPKPEPPQYEPEPPAEPSPGLDLDELRQTIKSGMESEALLNSYNRQLKEIGDIVIDETLDSSLEAAKKKLSVQEKQLNKLNQSVKNKENEIKNIIETIIKSKDHQEKIRSIESKILTDQAALSDWQYIASMLQPNKIPAMEFEVFIGQIDRDATENIKPYREGRYSFETITKDGEIDRFNILIHDNEKGESKSILKYSPGVKAFIIDSYRKALIGIRKKITYSPVISDEADGPIEPDLISIYYDIQKKYYDGKKILCTTHARDAHQYINNHVQIKDLLTNKQDGNNLDLCMM